LIIRVAAQAQAIATYRWVFTVAQVWYDDGDIIQAPTLSIAVAGLGTPATSPTPGACACEAIGTVGDRRTTLEW
jgi:hypothetical protein